MPESHVGSWQEKLPLAGSAGARVLAETAAASCAICKCPCGKCRDGVAAVTVECLNEQLVCLFFKQ